jgi:hypothetical protein
MSKPVAKSTPGRKTTAARSKRDSHTGQFQVERTISTPSTVNPIIPMAGKNDRPPVKKK